MKKILTLDVIEHKSVGSMILLTLGGSGESLPECEPGQFAQIQPADGGEVLLRRPISICRATDKSIELLVKPIGKGTRAICAAKALNIILPLGKGFTTPSLGEKVLLVGGGVGAAPLVSAAELFAHAGAEVTIALGGRSAAEVIPLTQLFGAARIVCSTDDGTFGTAGLITRNAIFEEKFDRIYCCGPGPMMRAVAHIAATRGVECEVSLENRMACGIGACLCCVEKTMNGNECVCTSGPVFNIKRLGWE